MSSRAGLFDFEFNKRSIFDPEINSKGEFDPDFSTTAVTTMTPLRNLMGMGLSLLLSLLQTF
jgi:hypothetical protein